MESNQIVYIRTDGNREIATGHIMRCLTIAKEVTVLGGRVTFVVSDEESEQMLRERFDRKEQYPVLCLHSVWNRLEEELESMRRMLTENRADCLLLDSYFVTEHYMKTLRSYVRLVYLDDTAAFDYPADVIVNYDVGVQKAENIRGKYHGAKKVLLGESFAPLRRQFRQTQYQLREKADAILISTGGTDEYDIAPAVVRTLRSLPETKEMTLHVLTGSSKASSRELERMAGRDASVKLYHGVENMAALMAQCDFAVSAAGTTLFELCCVGVPSVSFSMADNQVPCALGFAEAGYLPYAGDIRKERERVIQELGAVAVRLTGSAEERRKLSAKMRKGIDGNGAEYIAEAILNEAGTTS